MPRVRNAIETVANRAGCLAIGHQIIRFPDPAAEPPMIRPEAGA